MNKITATSLTASSPYPTVLVVEDEALVRMLLAESLRDAGSTHPATEPTHEKTTRLRI
jgi:CheY-like chemotaxis protein